MPRPFPRRYRIFLWGVGAPAAVVAAFLMWDVAEGFGPPSLMTALLLGGLVISDAVVFAIRTGVMGSTSGAFAFALLLTDGVEAAALGMATASAVTDLGRGKSADSLGFNAAQYVLSWGAAALVLEVLTHRLPEGTDLVRGSTIAAVVAAGATFLVVNHLLVAGIVSLQQDRPWGATWRMDFWRAAADDVGPLTVGTLIAASDLGMATAVLFLLPFVTVLGARQTIDQYERALRDPLTGLVTRALFADRLSQAIQRATRTGVGGCVLVIDLDGFKQVNDVHGHQAGDTVLAAVAARMQAALRAVDTVARLGGDEFAVLLVEQPDPAAAEVIARKLVEEIDRPVSIGSRSCQVGASIGSALFPTDGEDVDVLLQHADEVMYRDKADRRRSR
jgi:diguanylate cyclase (GGDEF)-like protein